MLRRTLLSNGPTNSSRWCKVAPSVEKPSSGSIIYLRRRDGIGTVQFHRFIKKQLVRTLAGTAMLKELRTQVFLPWSEKLGDSPNVAATTPTTNASPPR